MSDKLTDDALEHLRKEIRRIMNDLADHIAGGACRDYPEYTYCTGKIAGLAEAETQLVDLRQRLLEA